MSSGNTAKFDELTCLLNQAAIGSELFEDVQEDLTVVGYKEHTGA